MLVCQDLGSGIQNKMSVIFIRRYEFYPVDKLLLFVEPFLTAFCETDELSTAKIAIQKISLYGNGAILLKADILDA